MKKFLVHILYIFIISFLVIFSFLKAKEAEYQLKEAEALYTLLQQAEQQAKMEENNALMAVANAKKAEIKAIGFQKELEACRNNR